MIIARHRDGGALMIIAGFPMIPAGVLMIISRIPAIPAGVLMIISHFLILKLSLVRASARQ